MSKEKLISDKTLIAARKLFDESRTSLTRPMIMEKLARSSTATARAINKLKEEGYIARAAGADEKGRFLAVYHRAGRQLVSPPGVKFKLSERRRADRGNLSTPRQVTVQAVQSGIERPWYLQILFGNGPAGSAA